jgi:hypothetical protein
MRADGAGRKREMVSTKTRDGLELPQQARFMPAIFRTLLTAIVLVSLASCGLAKAGKAASKAAESFHEQYNESKFTEIYQGASPDFKKGTSEAEFVRSMEAKRLKLGRFLSGTRTGCNVSTRRSREFSVDAGWSSESGTTVVVTFASTFEKGSVTEVLSFLISGEQVMLQDYKDEPPAAQPEPSTSKRPSANVL